MKKNLFIVLDGIDGSGKGEMVAKLHNYLFKKDKKFRILTTREPTYGRYGRIIRKLLKTDSNPKKNAEKLLGLYVNDRKEHLKNTILPFLRKINKSELNIVLCDRYYYSTIAYQHAQGIDIKKIIELNKDFKKPDVAFILDLSPKLALERIYGRKKAKEKFENLEFIAKVRKNFLMLSNYLGDNIKIIDASKPRHYVFKQIKDNLFILL